MTDRSLDHLHPDLKSLAERWLAACHAQHIDARIYGTWRDPAEQARLYAVGRDASGKVIGRILTKSRPGQSKHEFTIDGKPASKAFDWFIQEPDGKANWDPASPEWKAAVAIGKRLGLRWGGDFPRGQYDADHFEIA